MLVRLGLGPDKRSGLRLNWITSTLEGYTTKATILEAVARSDGDGFGQVFSGHISIRGTLVPGVKLRNDIEACYDTSHAAALLITLYLVLVEITGLLRRQKFLFV